MNKIFICCMAVVLMSCDKAGSRVRPLEGTYIGYYQRNSADTEMITVRFNGNDFVSESTPLHVPEQCRGSFEQKEDMITFHDSCSQMSAFRPFIVLNGKFEYDCDEEGTLKVWRETGSVRDEYILRKVYDQR